MRTTIIAALALSGLTACGSTRSAVQPSLPEPELYVVEVVGAELQTERPDQRPWDESKKEAPTVFQLTTPVGSLSLQVGTMSNPDAVNPGAPDPAVTLQFNGRTVTAPPSSDSFSPHWSYRFVVDPRQEADAVVTLAVYDDDGETQQAMGSVTVPMESLLGQDRVVLPGFGSVKSLELLVYRTSEQALSQNLHTSVVVPADAPDWINTGLDVLDGQHLALAAEGRVRLSRFSTAMWGPEGVTDPQLLQRWQAHNLKGFEQAPHGALVGCVVDLRSGKLTQTLYVGDGLLTRLTGSGRLMLLVNDIDAVNNSGAFRVTVGGASPTTPMAGRSR